MLLGCTNTRARMDSVFVWQIVFMVSLLGFGIWFSRLSLQMSQALRQIEDGDDRVEEIREAVEQVVLILNRLPELLPSFHMQNSPTDFLKPIVEAFVGNITGAPPPLKTVEVSRGPDGQYDGTTKGQETNNKA